MDTPTNEQGKSDKGAENMAMIKEKKQCKEKVVISRQELRKRLIQEVINDNRETLERLSRT